MRGRNMMRGASDEREDDDFCRSCWEWRPPPPDGLKIVLKMLLSLTTTSI